MNSGEKLGFMITLMLTSVIYVEYMQISIPVFDTIGETPFLLRLFLATVILLALSLLGMSPLLVIIELRSNSVTVVTLFFYHISGYELINFSRTEARISIALATFFTKITFGLWVIEVPTEVQKIEADVSDQRHLQFSIKTKKHTREADANKGGEEVSFSESVDYYSLADDAHPLRIGFRFLADMINRLFFMIVCCSLVVTLGMTLIHLLIQYDNNDDETLIRLENDAALGNVKSRSVKGNLSC